MERVKTHRSIYFDGRTVKVVEIMNRCIMDYGKEIHYELTETRSEKFTDIHKKLLTQA